MMPDQGDSNAVAEQRISQWLDLIWRLRPEDYVPIEDLNTLPDGARVAHDSLFWTGKFLTGVASPYDTARRVRRSIHHATADSFDTLRHEYDSLGKPLVVEETANLLLVTVDVSLENLQTKSERAKQAEIHALAELVLNIRGTMVAQNLQGAPYQWVFRFPDTIREGTRFSTAPEQDPLRMWSWASRVDGGIHQGRLYFLGFKKPESTSGRNIVPDPQHWFDGKAWDAFR